MVSLFKFISLAFFIVIEIMPIPSLHVGSEDIDSDWKIEFNQMSAQDRDKLEIEMADLLQQKQLLPHASVFILIPNLIRFV